MPMSGLAAKTFRSLFLLMLPVLMLPGQAMAQPCSARGAYWGQLNYIYTLYMLPGWTCTQYFNPVARILGGGSRVPSCGRWGYVQDAKGRPGFWYQAYNTACHDALQIRIQMPDRGLWDYHFVVAVYPNGWRVPGP
jgi:hypothetical protein